MFVYSESPRSTRDPFLGDFLVDRDAHDSPFDEPPLLAMRFNPSTAYKLDSVSTNTDNDCIVEGGLKAVSNALSQELNRKISSACSLLDSEDSSSAFYGSHDEHSDASSFFSEYQNAEKYNSHRRKNKWDLCDNRTCGDLKTFCGLPTSSFRSKPLPKPVVWEGYTCFNGACLNSSKARVFPCEEKKLGGFSICENELCRKPEVHTKYCCDALPSDASSDEVKMQGGTDVHYFFDGESLQEHIRFVKMTAHHFLKKRMFFDDPNYSGSKDDYLDDLDSITYTSG